MKLSLIVAMDRNGLIGKGGGLPWGRIPEDMRHFRAMTTGKTMIVGRKTWDGLPPTVTGRRCVVFSRRKTFGDVSRSYHFRMDLDRILESGEGAFVIGGAATYAALQPYTDSAHVTVIDGEFEGDTWFPFKLFDTPEWAPLQSPVTLAPGVVYHKLGRAAKP